MLVARRDPPFHVDAQEAAPTHPGAYQTARAPRLARFVTTIQLMGSLLAVPVGIASAYTFYRANFSPEISCQNLRSGIVAILDKSVDAATRRALVRRDIEAFEKVCGTVDPDAAVAFKALLSVNTTAAPAAAAPVAPKVQRSEVAPKEAARKSEPKPEAVAKQPSTSGIRSAAEPVRRDPNVSDTQWLDAVRQALLSRAPPRSPGATHGQVGAQAPAARPMPAEAASPAPVAVAPAPVVQPRVPTLPPTIAVTPPAAQQQADVDHPVPPESIPELVPPAEAAKPDERGGHSRIGKWISEIPLLGPVVENARQ
jgi:hypothetical protein